MTGFYKMSACIFGFITDAGLPQRLSFFNTAISAVGANPPPSVTVSSGGLTGFPVATLPLKFTATFSEAVTNFTVGKLVASSGSVVAITTLDGGGSSVFAISVDSVPSAGSVTLTVPVDGAFDLDGKGNVRSHSATLEYGE